MWSGLLESALFLLVPALLAGYVDQAGGDMDAVPAERVTLAIFPFRYVGGEAAVCRLLAFT